MHLHRRYCIINVLLISGSVWGVGAWRLHSFSLSSNATTTKNLIRSRGGHAIPTWALRTWSASVPLAILFCPLVLQCTTINSLWHLLKVASTRLAQIGCFLLVDAYFVSGTWYHFRLQIVLRKHLHIQQYSQPRNMIYSVLYWLYRRTRCNCPYREIQRVA